MTEQTERSLTEPLPTADAPHPAGPHPESPALRPLREVRRWPRDFTDRLTAPLPGVRALARIAREGKLRPSAQALLDIPELPFEPGPLPEPGPREIAVTWVGHASWVLRVGGLTVLTDPVWSRKILGTPPRVTPVGVRWQDLPPVDAVVISHNHYDHLDLPTLKQLPPHTPYCCPPDSPAGPAGAASPTSPTWTGGRPSNCPAPRARSASTSCQPTTGASAP